MDHTKPGWEIRELYKKSWELVKKYKVPWIFGMAVATASIGSSFNNVSNFSDTKQFNKFPQQPQNPEFLSQVLGTSTTAPFSDTLGQILGAIPAYFYILFGIEVLLVLFYFLGMSFIKSAWAQAALIHSIQTGLEGKEASIHDSSKKAFANIKTLVWLQIVPLLVFLLIALISGLFMLALISFGSGFFRIITVFLLLSLIGAFFYGFLYLSLSLIWAVREVVMNHKSGPEALKAGYKLAKYKFWPMLILCVVNFILSTIILAAPTLILGGFFAGGISSFQQNPGSGLVFIPFGVVLFIIYIFTSGVLSGILTAFKTSVWNLAYTKIRHLND